jgi:hypothetical protein
MDLVQQEASLVLHPLADGQDIVPSRAHRHQADQQQVLPAMLGLQVLAGIGYLG